MAQGEASLIVTLVDRASRGLRDISKQVRGFSDVFFAARSAIGAFQATFGTLFSFLKESAVAFSEQESAVVKLNSSLRSAGIFSSEASQRLQEYAEHLQRTTGFADELIISTQALSASYGFNEEQIKKVTVAAADLSVKTGVDLRTATMMVAKAANGSTDMLGRLGVSIGESSSAAERFNNTMKAVAGFAGGEAQAQVNTFAGRVNQLSLAWGEVKESVGAFTTSMSSGLIVQLTDLLLVLNRLIRATAEWSGALKVVQGDSSGLMETARAVGDKLLERVGITKTVQEVDEKALADQQNAAALKRQMQEDETLKFVESKQRELDEYGLNEAEKALRQTEFEAVKLEKAGQAQLANELLVKKQRDVDKAAAAEKLEITRSTLTMVGALATSKSKELMAIGKAANIASAIMDTYAGANKAFSQGGFFGFAMASAIIAAGLANVAKIAGVQLAEGGMILPRSGGTLATIGEGGRSEAVIPLGDDRANEALRDTLGGGITINLYAQYADRAAFEEFVSRVDEELFRLRRNRQSVAFG